mgnify:CR=1 FL=1
MQHREQDPRTLAALPQPDPDGHLGGDVETGRQRVEKLGLLPASGLGPPFELLGVGAVVLLVVAAARARTGWWALGIGLILGGAIGNLIDRLFSPPGFGVGHVTDFLAYGNLFIGNLADVALGAGVIVLGLSLWTRHRRSRVSADSAAPATGSVVSGS